MGARPPIPEKIKRKVRQRCGFGCVICGCPIYEYDHVVEWSKSRRHVEDELTLLCGKHHAEKTKGILPSETVRDANRNPLNLRKGVSSPQLLYYSGESFKLTLGGTTFTYKSLRSGQIFFPFVIDGEPVVGFFNDSGEILLNVDIRNELNESIFKVDKSEVIFSSHLWDVHWVGRTLTIRERARGIVLEILFNSPSGVIISRGSLHFNGVELEIGHDYIYCLNARIFLSDVGIDGFENGFAIGSPAPSGACGIFISNVERPVKDRNSAKNHLKNELKKRRDAAGNSLKPKQTLGGDRFFFNLSARARLLMSGSPISYK